MNLTSISKIGNSCWKRNLCLNANIRFTFMLYRAVGI
jgi:hypothetical protein